MTHRNCLPIPCPCNDYPVLIRNVLVDETSRRLDGSPVLPWRPGDSSELSNINVGWTCELHGKQKCAPDNREPVTGERCGWSGSRQDLSPVGSCPACAGLVCPPETGEPEPCSPETDLRKLQAENAKLLVQNEMLVSWTREVGKNLNVCPPEPTRPPEPGPELSTLDRLEALAVRVGIPKEVVRRELDNVRSALRRADVLADACEALDRAQLDCTPEPPGSAESDKAARACELYRRARREIN